MVYFELNRLGFDCGIEKEECAKYPEECINCIKSKLLKQGFKVHSNLRVNEMDSEEKRTKVYQNLIWQKFLDVLNIKHIILMSKTAGTTIIDYPITGAGVDVDLLTGFVQANVSFSEKEVDGEPIVEEHYYEFKYKDFNILLKSGDHIRASLVLENPGSKSLKLLLMEFIEEFEFKFISNLQEFEKTGQLTFNKSIDYIIDKFNIHLVFPMTTSHIIPPNITEQINNNYVQKAIMKMVNELLVKKPFFFINSILYKVKEIVNIDLKVVLYEIYNLIDMGVIFPKKLEHMKDHMESFHQEREKNLVEKETLISRLMPEDKFKGLEEKIKEMDEQEALNLMDSFISSGKIAEEAFIYEDALNSYEKAKYIAKQFKFEEQEGKISFMILEIQKKIMDMELEHYLGLAKKGEKDNNYIYSVNYYKKAIKIFNDKLMTVQVDPEQIKKRIAKIDKKIEKLTQKMETQ
ncbi:MAG: hypothetical protein BAJALOKI1v1_400019 [Promethearchaeota archaeon]|nr:MAG: hypothetical protein BAJALOKI1v1_400019 [Candidatus Lokiarchaeota archaeon]